MKIIIVGKSASGKDFLKEVLKKKGGRIDVGWTTRDPRHNEVDGVDMNFTSREHFMGLVKTGHMLQYQEFNGNLYGTNRSSWETQNIFIMNVGGLKQLSEYDRKRAIVVYINPGNGVRFDRLMKRDFNMEISDLERRLTDDNDIEAIKIHKTVNDRLAADQLEYAEFDDFDFEITNSDYVNINIFGHGA